MIFKYGARSSPESLRLRKTSRALSRKPLSMIVAFATILPLLDLDVKVMEYASER